MRRCCERVRARYGRSCELFDYDLVIDVAKQIMAQREPIESPRELELMGTAN